VDFETRLEEARHCILVIMGADAGGHKELVGLWDGYRESEQSWKELLLALKSRGLEHGPALGVSHLLHETLLDVRSILFLAESEGRLSKITP